MIGRTLGHYRILEKVGAGGMGEIYRARDESLGRDVALKLLPAESLGEESARTRLLREARTASALNHPNICTIHEVGEADGRTYIAMEHVPGRALSSLIPAGGVPVETLLRYGVQIAAALAHAHERGVVHRDLKSANVVITPEGVAKVLDFGLARRLEAGELEAATKSRATVTEAGAAAGTLHYMAPETLRGEPADARSDIWALGVMLYEMASGDRPFRGQTGYELSSAILREPPAPIPSGRVPAGVGAIIQRCLAKEPGQRYQRAGELRAALEAAAPATVAAAEPRRIPRWALAGAALVVVVVLVGLAVGPWRQRLSGMLGGEAGRPRIESVAVLPLANLSRDPEQDYFADGMTEALITDLAQISSLRVISRTSVMRYKGTEKPLPEIALELKVDAVVEGSVQRAGDRVRITAQLVHGPSDRHLWAKSYERDLGDILGLQGEVAQAIAREIRIALTPQEQARLVGTRRVDPEAYQLYLKGRYHFNRRTPGWRKTSPQYFEQAIARDPAYAAPYAGLADAYTYAAVWGLIPPEEAWPKAEAAARRALELDDSLSEAHVSIGALRLVHDWDWAAAEKELKRAIELNRSHPDAHSRYGQYLRLAGRLDEALAEARRARELGPLRVDLVFRLGFEYIFARRYDEARQQFQDTLELDPGFAPARYMLAQLYEVKGMYEEAATETLAYLNFQKREDVAKEFERTYRAKGYPAAAKLLRRKDLEAEEKKTRPDAWSLACLYALLGEKDKAFEWLEKSYQRRDAGLLQMQVDPDLVSLHSDPRFDELVRRMNFPR